MIQPWRGASVLACLITCLMTVQSAPLLSVGQRVVEQLTHLATFTDDPNPAVTRILFTLNDMKARSYVKELMAATGLAIREDSVGNIFGRWEGSHPSEGAILTGSHTDAIPLAGMYDGTLGVIGAIEALAVLKRGGFQPRRALEVMMFTSEEPTRFALGCLGSRAMAGQLTAATLDARKDENGTVFFEAANAVNYGGESHEAILAAALVPEGRYSHFVELHIEQGPELEANQIDIGVVTAIAAPAALNILFHGDGGHAGAQLMPLRNDASLAAAEVALGVERFVLATGAADTVGTTGVFEVKPGASNSVPREARLGIDVRDTDGPRRDHVVKQIVDLAHEVAARRKVRVEVIMVNQDPPATCASEIVEAAADVAASLGLSTQRMVSRAYHDSLFMARIAPTAMVFIPCKSGWSHRPDEYSSPQDISNGVHVLALTMAKLSGGTWPEGHTEL
eukprot:CAMPEP_0119102132 /NCGR_PEP_ID=MMETSP1180-20130426/986_1 /TAXON_ID=3052 ORGANISM="Chlamydomonas cf sp, Strain CCMP681" /NCGR_SAMPLE_ID=MMETSP1180 /ASSEMBLY_ACC=CAM_ASM_000741 /LENGTH=450 /DNA_ID=CAMNT_0007086367 /DNA_START=50 /DNA_END=1402 /DNA_ORIENTATION=+